MSLSKVEEVRQGRNVSRFQGIPHPDEEEDEPDCVVLPYNKYGFVDHPIIKMEDQRKKFTLPIITKKEINWLVIEDANNLGLESTTSNQPMSLTMEDIGGS
ncbi:hypothetical protein Tco_1059849 [Tanacetum coccineum]